MPPDQEEKDQINEIFFTQHPKKAHLFRLRRLGSKSRMVLLQLDSWLNGAMITNPAELKEYQGGGLSFLLPYFSFWLNASISQQPA